MGSRLLAIGDTHGCDVALETLLQRLELSTNDTLVVLGDVVDRGPNTRRVLDLLIELSRACRLAPVLGNHEEMMQQALAGVLSMRSWLRCGGFESLTSYGGIVDDIPQAHYLFLDAMLPYWETKSEIFVHAGIDPSSSLVDQESDVLRWQSTRGDEAPHVSGKRVICGHTHQQSGRPRVSPGWVCLDTWAYGDGWLSCLDVDRDIVYQANQRGEYRILRLT
ncbi:MAG: metallophosphoesterase family protein [Planctomycetaceae bacterium]|nr:metallophosphoesterase family protein [Planctomycetaceae bacterium]